VKVIKKRVLNALFFVTIYYICTSNQNNKKMAIKRNLKNQILTLRNQGKSYREIQKELICSRGTINYHCRENELTDIGMKIPPVDTELKSQIADYCKDSTLADASKYFGLSLSTIKKYKKYQD
jgi:transposase